MADFTTRIVGQFISGQVLFWGLALCLLGCFLSKFSPGRLTQAIARLAVLVGAIFIILSAAPLPFWMYGIFFGLLLLLLWLRFNQKAVRGAKSDYALLALLLAQMLVMTGMEIRHLLPPTIPLTPDHTLFVLGDSMSIGADPPGKNWPDLLGDLAHMKVRNFAFGGAKVETALDEALRINTDDALVILELGGNDLLGGTPIGKFRADLEKMLVRVCTARRKVVMIELPLPPFYNRYGMTQRALARAHGVTLVSKRYLASVLSTPGATVDGLHLSNTGHTLFAHALFDLRDARPSSTAEH
jgi:acyl-CoA thioesterase I